MNTFWAMWRQWDTEKNFNKQILLGSSMSTPQYLHSHQNGGSSLHGQVLYLHSFRQFGGKLKVLSESFRPWLFSSKNNPHAKVIFWGGRFCSPILASPVFFCNVFISYISFCPFQTTHSIPNLFAKSFFFSNTLFYLISYYFLISKSENTPLCYYFFKFMNVLICRFFQWNWESFC